MTQPSDTPRTYKERQDAFSKIPAIEMRDADGFYVPYAMLEAETLRRQQLEHERDCLVEALASAREALEERDEWIAVLFDGYAVYDAIQHSTTLTPSDVSRVLDAVVAIARKRCAALSQSEQKAPGDRDE